MVFGFIVSLVLLLLFIVWICLGCLRCCWVWLWLFMLGGLVSFMLVGTRGVLFLLGFAMLVWWFGGFMLLLWQIFRGFRLVLICFVC